MIQILKGKSMEKINLTCLECDADFKITHNMDDIMYSPRYCVFCGTEIDFEDESNFDLEDEDDDEY